MSTASILVRRNVKLFFKDKGMFFTSLITPVILLVLYAAFLGDVYRDSFEMNLPASVNVPEKLVNALVGGQLISSLLAVCCVTVAFCANFLMVQDKANGNIRGFRTSPLRASTLALSYYIAAFISAMIICLAAMGICLGYVATVGWYMSACDVMLLLLDVVLLVLFGTALSSVINFFLSTQGQISAVGTVVSSGYGFICGAYMPISSFAEGLQKIMLFLPGTYATVLVRTHSLRGVFGEMQKQGVPTEVVRALKDSLDCNLYFGGETVSAEVMYLILCASVAALIFAYVLMNRFMKGKSAK